MDVVRDGRWTDGSGTMGGQAQRRRERNWIRAKLGVEERAKRDLPKGEIGKDELDRPPKKLKHIVEYRSGASEKKRQEEKRKHKDEMERKKDERQKMNKSVKFEREKEGIEQDKSMEDKPDAKPETPKVMHTSREIEAAEERKMKDKRKGFLQLRKEKKKAKQMNRRHAEDDDLHSTKKLEHVPFGETVDKPPDITLRRKGMPGTETGKKSQERLSKLFRKQFKDAQAKAAGKPTSKEIQRKKKQQAAKPLVDEKLRLDIIQAYRKKRGHLL